MPGHSNNSKLLNSTRFAENSSLGRLQTHAAGTSHAITETPAVNESCGEREFAMTNEAHSLRQSIREAACVCRAAAEGNLELRVLHISPDLDPELSELLHSINDKLRYDQLIFPRG